jgi:hypothetical protein
MNIQDLDADYLLKLITMIQAGQLKRIVLTIDNDGVDLFIVPIKSIKSIDFNPLNIIVTPTINPIVW